MTRFSMATTGAICLCTISIPTLLSACSIRSASQNCVNVGESSMSISQQTMTTPLVSMEDESNSQIVEFDEQDQNESDSYEVLDNDEQYAEPENERVVEEHDVALNAPSTWKPTNGAGIFEVPDVGISVDTFATLSQEICDAENSACVFPTGDYGMSSVIVADHMYQAFATLENVSVGMPAYVYLPDGSTLECICTNAYGGHHVESESPYDILDGDYNSIYGRADIICYTCMSLYDWTNIHIREFTIIGTI